MQNKKYRYPLELVGLADVNKFVAIVTPLPGVIKLTDGDEYTVNARSLLGALASMEWESLYCVSETDIYTKIKDFVRDESPLV